MRGVVVAPQPLAAQTGRAILQRGGNAVDAAVAAAFAQTVTDPLMCGIGGMGVSLVRTAAGEQKVVSFYGRFGSRARSDMWADRVRGAYVEGHPDEIGYESILIPGTVAGLAELHARWGTLPWADLVRPAAGLARAGVPLYAYIEDYFRYPMPEYGPTQLQRLSATTEMARLWLRPDGSFRTAGELMVNPDYADTLEALAAKGAREFYAGELGRRIAADLAAHGSHITADDLAAYRPLVDEPLTGQYRGHEVVTNGLPGGGISVLKILGALEAHPIGQMAHNGPEHAELLVRAIMEAFAERKAKYGDPMRSGTTHLSVCDEHGNCVAITHTLAGGSGVITPGLGFQYNGAADLVDPEPGRPNSIAPGKARLSAMAPTLVLREGHPAMILGAPGSDAIINAVVQVITNRVDFGMTPLGAVSAPRVHCNGGPVLVETRVSPETVRALEGAGHQVQVRPFAYDTLQGRVQLVCIGADGVYEGASDPRRDGGVAVYS